nr:type VI secretion system contractile sheath large subunit [uncultured Roseobacter sp.]
MATLAGPADAPSEVEATLEALRAVAPAAEDVDPTDAILAEIATTAREATPGDDATDTDAHGAPKTRGPEEATATAIDATLTAAEGRADEVQITAESETVDPDLVKEDEDLDLAADPLEPAQDDAADADPTGLIDDDIRQADPDEEDTVDTDFVPAEDTDKAEPEDDETPEPSPHGRLDLPEPDDREAPRPRFRIAVLGDFTGRAATGTLQIGADLAARKPMRLDVDTLDDVIARFATTLILPLGTDGAGIEVPLSSLDDLRPDELYENVAVFDELKALRSRIARGLSPKDAAQMHEWASLFGDLKPAVRSRAKGAAVPAGLKLSTFQTLIGDTTARLRTPSPAEDLIGRIVGPHVQAATDPDQPAMLAAVDAAISGTMRAILHHPDFQAVEATWRSLELLARRIRTGPAVDIVLYDVSAEEWAADLASDEDLSQTGLFQMLAEEPRLDEGQGALSAVFGLYTLEETPPHADLMARMAKVSAWMNAPFLAAISDSFLATPKHERHPLVAKSWDALRELPQAQYAALAAPGFLLRLPYGARTEPVDAFDFEEFTLREGLKGMLWANPVVLSAVLMCETVNQKGKTMKLGDVMSLGDMPMHVITDPHGDQVALPVTTRLLNTTTMAQVVARGYIPLVSIKGRNEVRQGSFQGLGAGMLAGPWGQSAGGGTGLGGAGATLDITREAGDAPDAGDDFGPSRPGGAGDDYDEQFASADAEEDDDDLGLNDDDMDLSAFDLGDDDTGDDAPPASGDDDDLDALLADLGGDEDAGSNDDAEIDADLAALLADL